MNFLDLNIPFYPAAHRRTGRRLKELRNRRFLTVVIIGTVLVLGLIAAILCIYFLVIKRTHTQGMVSLTNQTRTENNNQTEYCIDRRFNLTADILYSFDCYNVTDDISGTYNGIADAYLHPNLDNATLRTMLPTYVTPDYSGQGAALKLDSSYAYQYIELVRSPNFFYTTFTISAWVKPNLSAGSVAVLFAQSYQSASTFAIGMVDLRPRIRVYNTYLGTSNQLMNSQWQYVTYVFSQDALSMAVYVDGILESSGTIVYPDYGNFTIEQTTIGITDGINQYNGVIDQLNIAFHVKNQVDVLNEATLVAYYTFETNGQRNDSIFNDASANSISATGAYLTRLIGIRRAGQASLRLNNSTVSWFQSSGFALLITFNYTYSYAFWLNIENVSSFMPLAHLVAKYEVPTAQNSGSICLAMLVATKTNINNNAIQLSLYIYGSVGNIIITSTELLSTSTWNHIAVVLDTNGFTLFINGNPVASSTGSNLAIIQVNNQQRLTLTIGNPARSSINDNLYTFMCHDGAQTGTNQNVIDIDNLQFYSRPLKVQEIQALANDNYASAQYFFT